MKLTPTQIENLVGNTKLHLVIQNKLAECERMTYHSQPVQVLDTDPQEEKEAFNSVLMEWERASKIKDFNRLYFPKIANSRGIEKRIFVLALADFNYEGIDGLTGDALVGIIASSTYKEVNIIDRLIDQMFKKVMFPPEKVS